MLRYKTETRPGLVALYDIWPGNRSGPFLQPRSPQGANWDGHPASLGRILALLGLTLAGWKG